MHIISLNNNYDILYTEKYSPPLYFLPFRPHCQRANLRLDEQKYLTLSLLKPNLVWANSSLGETVCNCRKAKILWGETNPVYF